ncbi:MAG: glycosyltransferase family 2 protein [Opitutus sp.]|nr:glycosyltransferase family 2 protein [Opitutus sp.]MCS6274340.1 glycosyltransferase family 2 protein [Opitutus sp.]MCS6277671.1 glycosyltransferase family 2 protein [Opitutus sp.]MCS6300789.1 glycosyltransferase family 2 protein [Opitutus sp.]
MENHPLVSVLIPVYNRVKLVEEAIRSALNQTYPNIEIIVSDNCSTDGTWERLQELAREDNRLIVVRTTHNVGPVPNWQHCLNFAKGEYIKFLFSDDWMRSDCLELMVSAMKINPGIKIVFSSVLEFNGKTTFPCVELAKGSQAPLVIRRTKSLLEIIQFKLPISPGAALFRRGGLSIISGFEDEYLGNLAKRGIGPDYLMIYQAIQTEGCIIIPDFVNTFRRHDGSLSEVHSSDLWFGYVRFIKYSIGLIKYPFLDAVFIRLVLTLRILLLWVAVVVRGVKSKIKNFLKL